MEGFNRAIEYLFKSTTKKKVQKGKLNENPVLIETSTQITEEVCNKWGKKDKILALKGELPCMQVREHQGLVEGDFTEKLQQVLHLLLKNFVR